MVNPKFLCLYFSKISIEEFYKIGTTLLLLISLAFMLFVLFVFVFILFIIILDYVFSLGPIYEGNEQIVLFYFFVNVYFSVILFISKI